MEPRVHYARTGDGGDVAYTVTGSGPVLVWCQPFSHQQLDWRNQSMCGFYGALARSHTLVRYDMRGFGMSGLDGLPMTYDLLMADLTAVVEATADQPFDLAAVSGLGFPAITYAAAHPDRVRRLVLWGTPRRGVQFREGPRVRSMRAVVGIDADLALELQARWVFGDGRVGPDELAHARAVFGAGTNEAYIDVLWKTDLERELATLTVPTLVLQPTGRSLVSVEHVRALAASIPTSEFVLVDGDYYPYLAADQAGLVATINDFLGTLDEMRSPGPLGDVDVALLSARESEVLNLLTEGNSNPEIARVLTLSTRTVDRHVQNLYRKLGVRNRVAAANWAREHGQRRPRA